MYSESNNTLFFYVSEAINLIGKGVTRVRSLYPLFKESIKLL